VVRRALLAAALGAALACGSESSGPIFRPGLPTPQTAVLVGAGDIGECGPTSGSDMTARLLDSTEGTVFTAGDNAYPSGRAQDFRTCYEPTWGRHKARTRPAPGNHDYEVPGAADYFAYFGANAGPVGQGYYSYTAGNWLVLSLNSNVPIGRASAQMAWVQTELTMSASRCAMAYFHHSPFSSGGHGDHLYLHDMWRELHSQGVEIVVAAHDHLYERFAPMNGEGRLDTAQGTRLFIAGTGGARLVAFVRAAPNSEVRLSQFGVLKLTLRPGAYQWEFLQASGGVGDSGTGTCH
jgi:acid phosphatase type 7